MADKDDNRYLILLWHSGSESMDITYLLANDDLLKARKDTDMREIKFAKSKRNGTTSTTYRFLLAESFLPALPLNQVYIRDQNNWTRRMLLHSPL